MLDSHEQALGIAEKPRLTCRDVDMVVTHRHIKTGKYYAKVTDYTNEADLVDYVLYKDEYGRVWGRPANEFYDENRFEVLRGHD